MNEKELLKEALDLLEVYNDELGRMLRRDQGYALYIRHMELAYLALRYDALQKKCEKEGKNE